MRLTRFLRVLMAIALALSWFFSAANISTTQASSVSVIVTTTGSTSYEQNRIIRLAKNLNLDSQPAMPEWWNIQIMSGQEFEAMLVQNGIDGLTYSAVSFLGQGKTIVNENYLTFADDARVEQTLAHEAGHLICNCASEARANEIASAIIPK